MKALLFMLKKPFMGRRNDKNVETSLIERFYYPKKGPGQLWEAMADEIVKMGGVIHFCSEVTGVGFRDNKIVSVNISSGSKQKALEADYFLSSMAVSDLISAMGREIPENVRDIAAGLPYRDFMTAGLLVDKLKIKNTTKIKTVSDIVPDCWIYIQEPDVKAGRLQIFNNWSPYMVRDPKNTVWLGLEYFCEKGDEMWELPDKEFIELAAEEAVRIGIIENTSVLDSVRIKVEKAYPSYFGTYERFDSVRDYLSGIENLYCIGRNGQHRYNNMDHSMLTAIEAVRLITTGDPSKESLFKVNTEAEYHETK
jgi:protoporphyrinogen oxidase